jgi:hypothetical protein
VVIVGGGWGGLTAASRPAPPGARLEVVLVERDTGFRSLPLSNAWLVGRAPDAPPRRDYAAWPRARGYRAFCGPRSRPSIANAGACIPHRGARLRLADPRRRHSHDYAPWLGDDARAIEATRRLYPAGFLAGELDALQQKLAGLQGGELLMTVPPRPGALPAGALRARADDRLVAEDARHQGPPDPGRCRRRHAALQSHVRRALQGPGPPPDPRHGEVHRPLRQACCTPSSTNCASTTRSSSRRSSAARPRPQQAGLLEADAAGRPGAWAALRSAAPARAIGDERVFLVGDLLGRASPLFGHYPKSAHMAVRQGRIAAAAIAAQARRAPAPTFPESVCHVFTDIDPPEMMRIDAQLSASRRRPHHPGRAPGGRAPAARRGPAAWAQGLYAEMLAAE